MKQKQIRQAVKVHRQIISSITHFKATKLLEADTQISLEFSKTLRELIFVIKVKYSKDKKLFIALKQNYRGTYNLIYKECYHKKASTIAAYLSAY